MKTKISIYLFFVFFALFFSQEVSTQRTTETINNSWKFYKGDFDHTNSIDIANIEWEDIKIPHTWNAKDMMDDEPGYYRGVAWYKKVLQIPSTTQNKQLYLYFEAANQDAIIFLNGKKVGTHNGGYTAFCFNITDYLNNDSENILLVKLNNSYNKNVPPVGGDLGHFGGIYRDVYLIGMNNTHFDIDYFASSGIFITTPEINKIKAKIQIKSRIQSPKMKGLLIEHEILSPEGKVLATKTSKVKTNIHVTIINFENPKYWTPETPYLYTVRSTILNKQKEILDQVTNPLGLRTLQTDKDEGIFLNNAPIFIKGIGKHQDYKNLGYAVPNEVCRNDISLLKNTGANLVRSHYPLDPSTYDLCDEIGVMVWGKIPIMDKISHSQEFMNNTKNMMQEMMYQNFNRPSFILWGFACEIFGDMDWYWPKPQDPEKVKENLKLTEIFSLEMERFVREIDPYRLTANDFHTDPTPEFYKEANQTDLNMINGWNIYQGWYHNNLDSIGWALKTFRKYNSDVPFVIAEYGAGSDPRIHTYDPTIFDFSIEYQNMFHERYLKEASKYEFLHGLCVWTLFDFQVDGRSDAVPHINSKGLLRSDRKPKDSYYVYQSNWSDKPMVYIASHDWIKRKELVYSEKATRTITVYSNQQNVELFLNGTSLGIKNMVDHKAIWNVPFVNGSNQLEAQVINKNQYIKDYVEIEFTFVPKNLIKNNFPESGLCINIGQSRTFLTDELNNNIWMPDKEYSQGNYGHKNGEYYRLWNNMKAWNGIREGVGQNILGTDIDPIFQTFLVGITDYKIDVPDGEYEISLYFAEPFSLNRRQNMEEKTGADKNGFRIFDVFVNDNAVIQDLELSKQYGESVAVIKTFTINAKDNNGVLVKLIPIKGQAILNGIKINKI